MPKPVKRVKKSPEDSFSAQIAKIRAAGVASPALMNPSKFTDNIQNSNERVVAILQFMHKARTKKINEMLCFIFYDIENNKVRTKIAKYLLRKGCIRVQKSVFLAQLDRKVFQDIHTTIKKVQDLYENTDSILFLQVAEDELRSMRMVGQNIDTDLIIHGKNTLFF
jgi:CRISPR-associated protein Cas2